MKSKMQLILRDTNPDVVSAWAEVGLDGEVGSFFDIAADALVSPANSFGFMDGGLDYYISEYLGAHVQKYVQDRIRADFDGELLVGQAFVVGTGNAKFPNLICAPTMRVPMRIIDPADVRLATRAAIRAARNAGLGSIVMTGMGTGAGGISPRDAAIHMKAGIGDVFSPRSFPESWRKAAVNHYKPGEE